TAEGRETRYETQRGRSFVRSTVSRPDGLPRTTTTFANGASVLSRPDDSQASATVGPDPRFGMQTPVAESQQINLPSGLSWSSSFERSVELSDLNDPLSLESILDTVTVNGRRYTREYVAQERVLRRTSPEGRRSSTRIDDLGRVTETAIGELASIRFIRNDQGLLTSVRGGSGDRERVISFAYDTRGRLMRVSDPLSRSTHFEYNEADRLEAVTLRDGRIIDVDFDATGKLSSLTPPGRPAHHFSYTRTGRLSTYAPPAIDLPESASRFSYNLDRQPVILARPDAKAAELSYDPAGRLESVTLPNGELSFTYSEDTGLLADASSPYGVDLSYGYDGFVIASTAWSGAVAGSVERTYNDDLRLAVRTVNNTQPIDFSYDDDALLVRSGDLVIERSPANGLITGTTLGRITTGLSYNEFGEPTGLVAAFDSTELLNLSFEHDKSGRITRLTEAGGGWMTEIEYIYDDAGRLIEVLQDDSSTAEYVYDANGNRTALIDVSGTTTATYDDQDRLLTFGDVTYEYSANGELLRKLQKDQSMAFEYDVLGNLLSVTLPDGLLIEYVHDARGRRVGKVIGGTLVRGFLYKDRLNPVAELDGDGNVVSRFVYGTRSNVPDYMIREGVTYRIVSDHLSSPRQVVDVATGAI
ncbi:MAG: RHS repeat protein, partial [bacterium]|nr:RHS repeat protein [bacterium]